MKFCSRCVTEKPFSDFNRRGNGYQAWCRACQADYDKTESSDARIALRNARRREAQERNIEWVLTYLREHPCVDCGESDPVVLDFDHRGDKIANISDMIRRCFALVSIRDEVAKCDVRCANCHRRATAARNGSWWRAR